MATLDEIMVLVKQISDELPKLLAGQKLSASQIAVVEGLSDISKRLGLIESGEFRSGNGVAPDKGFIGVRIGYPPFRYLGQDWNIAGVYNDELRFGLRAEDGAGLFAGGQAIMDADAMKLTGLFYGIQATASNEGDTRQGKIGMVLREGSSIPAFGLAFEGPTSGSNLISNGDAETGDETGWTDSNSAWSMESTSPYADSYSFRHNASVTTYPGVLTQAVASLSPNVNYILSFASKLVSGEFTPKITITWKDSGGSTLRTDTIFGTNQPTWALRAQSILSPASTDNAVITLSSGDVFGDALFDEVQFYLAGIVAKILFTPDILISGGSLVVGNLELAQAATDGFLYIPMMNGAPSGTPTTQSNTVPIVYDYANNRIYIYNGAWKYVALT